MFLDIFIYYTLNNTSNYFRIILIAVAGSLVRQLLSCWLQQGGGGWGCTLHGAVGNPTRSELRQESPGAAPAAATTVAESGLPLHGADRRPAQECGAAAPQTAAVGSSFPVLLWRPGAGRISALLGEGAATGRLQTRASCSRE